MKSLKQCLLCSRYCVVFAAAVMNLLKIFLYLTFCENCFHLSLIVFIMFHFLTDFLNNFCVKQRLGLEPYFDLRLVLVATLSLTPWWWWWWRQWAHLTFIELFSVAKGVLRALHSYSVWFLPAISRGGYSHAPIFHMKKRRLRACPSAAWLLYSPFNPWSLDQHLGLVDASIDICRRNEWVCSRLHSSQTAALPSSQAVRLQRDS